MINCIILHSNNVNIYIKKIFFAFVILSIIYCYKKYKNKTVFQNKLDPKLDPIFILDKTKSSKH